MRKKLYTLPIVFVVVSLFLNFSSATAQGIKDRFKQRLPQIVQLKSEGLIGENNQGYLEFIGEEKKMADIVQAENRDRRLVYEKIAGAENTTVEKVGRRRALQLRDLAKPGDWIQGDDGKWRQK